MANRRYTRQFKEEAMKLATQQEYPVHRAAQELGMPVNTLANWLRMAGWEADKAPVALPGSALSEDPAVLKVRVRQLEEEVKRLKMEKEILKKATAFFASQNP